MEKFVTEAVNLRHATRAAFIFFLLVYRDGWVDQITVYEDDTYYINSNIESMGFDGILTRLNQEHAYKVKELAALDLQGASDLVSSAGAFNFVSRQTESNSNKSSAFVICIDCK